MNRSARTPSGFLRAVAGAASVEFALLAPLTFILLFAVFEGGWIMTQTIMLDHGFSKASRAIQLNSASLTYEEYKRRICAESLVLYDCEDMLQLELTPIGNASDFPTGRTPCVDRNAGAGNVISFNTGLASQLVFARACFVVDPLLPGLGYGLSLPKDGSGAIRLTSQFAFVNEPG